MKSRAKARANHRPSTIERTQQTVFKPTGKQPIVSSDLPSNSLVMGEGAEDRGQTIEQHLGQEKRPEDHLFGQQIHVGHKHLQTGQVLEFHSSNRFY